MDKCGYQGFGSGDHPIGEGCVLPRGHGGPCDTKPRCTWRKHVIEKGESTCDCGKLWLAPTAAKNAQVVTVLEPLTRDG